MEYFKDCMTLDELKARYKQWVLKLHPDRNPDNPNAESDFKDMQSQYEEREAELKGDYSKARKSRESREREERERAERERKEREQRKVEMVIEQARKNRNVSHNYLKAGTYIYARMVKTDSAYEWESLTTDELLHMVCKQGVNDECVVMIETIVEIADKDFFQTYFNSELPEGVWGGYEVLQPANQGRVKGKRVAKVIMFRSPSYCVFGNPMGDQTIRDYYMPLGADAMFLKQLDHIRAIMAHEQAEKKRKEEERKAKLLAEQQPLIEEWKDKLIELSCGLSAKEQQTVTMDNMKTMLKAKFPGTTFKLTFDKWSTQCINMQWEDGPTLVEVEEVTRLFARDTCVTPWMDRFGSILVAAPVRKMSTLTKARILQQLGQVTAAFRNAGFFDEVELTGFDMQLLEAMAGVEFADMNAKHCQRQYRNDHYYVRVENAVRFIFSHTNLYKPRRKTAKKKTT